MRTLAAAMIRIRTHCVALWLCVLACGLSALAGSGVVVCADPHGGVRVEWGCDRDARSACVTACGEEVGAERDHREAPHPCRDVPVGEDDQQLRAAPERVRAPALAPAAPVVCRVLAMRDVAGVSRTLAPGRPMRPPDGLARLRSVILLT